MLINYSLAAWIILALNLLLVQHSLAFSGKIALTFDDAPTPDSALLTGTARTQKIIAALKKHQVPDALFFVKADHLNPSTLQRLKLYTDAGFHLANHSFSHQSANQISADEFLVDAYRAHLALKDLPNFLPYFRPPFLHYGKTIEDQQKIQHNLVQLGYRDGFVTVDNADWYINSLLVKAAETGKKIDFKKASKLYVEVLWQAIEFYDAIAHKNLGASPTHVLLLHENDTSALFLADLIAHIRKQGATLVAPQDAFVDAVFAQFPATLFHKQGRVAALAHIKGVAIKSLKHPAEETEYLDKLFKKVLQTQQKPLNKGS